MILRALSFVKPTFRGIVFAVAAGDDFNFDILPFTRPHTESTAWSVGAMVGLGALSFIKPTVASMAWEVTVAVGDSSNFCTLPFTKPHTESMVWPIGATMGLGVLSCIKQTIAAMTQTI